MVEAAADLGLPPCADLNAAEPFGICASPYTVRDGRRLSTALAYLDPVRDRPNLTVLARTTALRLILDGTRVRGIELQGPDGPRTVVGEKVVLAAGVFHSPQLLALSGIGPSADLRALGIEVRVPLDGVGYGFQDHAVVRIGFAAGPELTEAVRIPKVRLIARSRPDLDLPDLHVLLRPAVRAADGSFLLPVSIHLLVHRSTGSVRLISSDPEALPVVDPGLLEHPDDRRAMVDGIGLVERFVAHPAVAGWYGPRVEPQAGAATDEHLLRTYGTYHHGVGTCRMGRTDDRAAVVGPDLRVHGVDGLLVADASVLPSIPHANTNLAAIMVAEIGARSIATAAPIG